MVLMISLTERRSRSHPHTPPHSMPPAAPQMSVAVTAAGRDQPSSCIPSAAATSAPITSWPSAPIFQSPPWKATDTAKLVKINGVVLTSVYSRMDVRVYAKAIRNGQASHALSQEEERVLREVAAR